MVIITLLAWSLKRGKPEELPEEIAEEGEGFEDEVPPPPPEEEERPLPPLEGRD